MDDPLTIVLVTVFCGGPLLLVTIVLWGIGHSNVRDAETPPVPHNPADHFEQRMDRWLRGLRTLADHGFGHRCTADGDLERTEVAEISGITRGGATDEDSHVHALVELRLADGSVTVHKGHLNAIDHIRPGNWVPYHPPRPESDDDPMNPAWDLDRLELEELLITHRVSLGLIDVVDAADLLTERPQPAWVRQIRPTGLIRLGQVEVELDLDSPHGRRTVTTFLRPEEIATARHGGQLPVVRTPDGRWVVSPTWY